MEMRKKAAGFKNSDDRYIIPWWIGCDERLRAVLDNPIFQRRYRRSRLCPWLGGRYSAAIGFVWALSVYGIMTASRERLSDLEWELGTLVANPIFLTSAVLSLRIFLFAIFGQFGELSRDMKSRQYELVFSSGISSEDLIKGEFYSFIVRIYPAIMDLMYLSFGLWLGGFVFLTLHAGDSAWAQVGDLSLLNILLPLFLVLSFILADWLGLVFIMSNADTPVWLQIIAIGFAFIPVVGVLAFMVGVAIMPFPISAPVSLSCVALGELTYLVAALIASAVSWTGLVKIVDRVRRSQEKPQDETIADYYLFIPNQDHISDDGNEP